MAIHYNEQIKTFYLESKGITYAFRINEMGFLQHLYYGKTIDREDLSFIEYISARGMNAYMPTAKWRGQSLNEYQNECPTFGRSDFRECMFAFCDNNGVRVADYFYQGHKILDTKPAIEGMPSVRGNQTLIVTLKDSSKNIELNLFYTVFEDLPVILRHLEVVNCGNNCYTLDRVYSFCVDMPNREWEIITLPGAHVRERLYERNKLSHGIFTVDSKRGTSSGQMNPFVAVVSPTTTEIQGEVFGFNLVYSGDFAFKAQIEENNDLRILGGINDYDFSWELRKNERFVTPEVVMVYSENGLGEMSRAYHDLYRTYLINPRFVNKSRPIVINNWEATYFDFTPEKLCNIIDSVKDTGIDTLVLDDGWFGKRDNDTSGLGDWIVNESKMPGGLKTVIDYAHKNGMKFGLWFEPEMVSPDSDLYRAHPDWAIHAGDLVPCLGRDQLVLDLTREEVCEYIINAVSKILNSNEIDYVKWDMNRSLTDNWSSWLGKNAKEMHHRYVLGLYKVCEALVNGFPNIIFEGCSSGGCRFDPAMLYYFPQIWTSDNSDAYMRTFIQYGTSICYPLSAQSCHVSVCPNHQCGRVTPLNARGDIAHLGATGYELDTTKLGKEDLATIKEQVEKYRQMEDLVLFGDLYRLCDPTKENLFAEMIVAKDKSKAQITVMRPISIANDVCRRIYPKGLDENFVYCITELNLTLTGRTIMNAGLIVNPPFGDFTTVTYAITKVK
ncbi:MAG: alpha-galactosidase [Clostridia bacterium]|nr:alpha-galactosidase [Clostridia bacterium]